jgi:hypothetical protein
MERDVNVLKNGGRYSTLMQGVASPCYWANFRTASSKDFANVFQPGLLPVRFLDQLSEIVTNELVQ